MRICGDWDREPESHCLFAGHAARKSGQPDPSQSEASLRRCRKTRPPARARVFARAARRRARQPDPRSADGAEPDPTAQPRDALRISSREPARSNQRRSSSIRRSRWRVHPTTSEGHSHDGRPLCRSGSAFTQAAAAGSAVRAMSICPSLRLDEPDCRHDVSRAVNRLTMPAREWTAPSRRRPSSRARGDERRMSAGTPV